MDLLVAPLLALAPLALPQEEARAVLSPADALHRVEGVTGPARVAPDLDGDGLADLVLERGGDRSRPYRSARVEFVSTRTGETLRRLHEFAEAPLSTQGSGSSRARRRWDLGGDVNGDGTPDLVVGEWRAGEDGSRVGLARVISGADGALLHETRGDAALDGYGYEVTFVGDVDGDGRVDYAVGAPQAALEQYVLAGLEITSSGGGSGRHFQVQLGDGEFQLLDDVLSDQLAARSNRPGYASVRSGADGSELLRVHGRWSGHGFGARLVRLGDLDGDGADELGVGSCLESLTPALVLSPATGAVLGDLPTRRGPFVSIGDWTGDGRPEIAQLEAAPTSQATFKRFLQELRILTQDSADDEPAVETEGFREEWTLPLPQLWSAYVVVAPLGDVDGDGHVDLALADADYNLPGPRPGLDSASIPDIDGLTLERALALSSQPHLSLRWESGCVRIVSGATGDVVQVMLGQPGSSQGVGLDVGPFPDQDGDGCPELLVVTEDAALVLPGIGKSEKEK